MAVAARSTSATPNPLPLEHRAQLLARASHDPAWFLCSFAKILVMEQGHGRIVAFVLWAYQTALITALARGGHFIILKARQLGITTLLVGYVLWTALFRPHSVILLLSKRSEESKDLLARVMLMYEQLPPWMKQELPLGKTLNSEMVTFANGSQIRSVPATAGAGRGSTASIVVIDEADYTEDLEETYAAVKPTVDAGGQLILASTSNGPQTYFATLWALACSQATNLRAVFFPWTVRPDRTPEWFALATATYTEVQRRREYPMSPKDAFSSAELLVYPTYEAGVHMDQLVWDRATRTVRTKRYGDFKIQVMMSGIDFNSALPGCLLVGGLAPDGTILIIDGHYEANVPVISEDPEAFTWANVARRFQHEYGPVKCWADHDPEAIMHLCAAGIPAVKAIKDVTLGIGIVTAGLQIRPDGMPGLIISRELEWMGMEFGSYRYRKTASGVLTDNVVKENDHALDAARYMVVGLAKGGPAITVLG